MKIMVAGVILAASPAHGVVYMWRDSAGIVHYTNKEYDVPARYKAKAKVLYPEASDSGTSQPGTANVPAAPVGSPPAVTGQGAGPAVQPVTRSAAPATQIESTPPKTPERRGRRHRERNADEDE
jgi:hypothetical protein